MISCRVIYIIGLLTLLVTGASTFGEAGQEYCQSATFTAECPPGYVVFIEAALYGRMELGDCVTLNYGSLGCSLDVLGHLDALCSGKGRCSFLVSSTLHSLEACQKDLVSYLQANWTCLPVVTGDASACSPNSPQVITQPHGFLASVVAQTTQRGSESCPWVLRAQPGQTINITVWNFARTRWEIGSSTTGALRARMCYMFAVLRDGGTERHLTECEGGPRVVAAEVSQSNEITVTFLSRQPVSSHQFLLQFDVLGCATPSPPRGARVRRLGDRLDVICNFTTEMWTIVCDGNRWQGAVGNCSQVALPNQSFFSPDGFPYDILLMVSIGVAIGVFVGGILLILASFYLKRKRQDRNLPASPPTVQGRIYDLVDPDQYFHTMPVYSRQVYGPRRSLSSGSSLPDPRPYGPYYTEPGHYSGRSTPSSHVYESPTSQRRFIF